ncbi:poly [ADP-ribose] polymerase 2 [Ambystoma mexicanum]|uniref:poly [ADP-ribose] polymerase 2 n=1 Tax=Ambystoma mexicanum TaxID=8296 RepID=UPI0037E7120E
MPPKGRGAKNLPAPVGGPGEPTEVARESRSGARKRKGEASAGPEQPKKSVLPADEECGPQLELRWEWQGDGDVWHWYSQESNKEITEAFRAGKSVVTISPNANVKLRIDLKKMIQKNIQSGFERPICAAAGGPDHYFIWQWEADDGSWTPYDPETIFELETAQQTNHKSVSVKFGKTSYTLELGKMAQINDGTKFERKMERKESGAVEFLASSQANSSASGDSSVAKKPSGAGMKKQAETKKPVKGKKAALKPDAETGGGDHSKAGDGDSKASLKTLVLNGKAPVDPECTAKIGNAHVYCEGDDIYDAMLNQTNLQFNNNKYYLIQLLEDDHQKNFSVWMRWGRVGKVGQNSLVACGVDLGKAKKIFEKKFLDKTENDWSFRDFFEKVPGKYDLLKMDYKLNAKDEKKVKTETQVDAALPKLASKLDTRIQDLLNLICNIQAMEERIVEMKFDTKKAPLGKLTLEQIKAGYSSLKWIEDCIKKKQSGRLLVEACNEFYTRIPHDFGLRTPPMIRTEEELKEKMLLLEALGDIEIAIKLVTKEVDSLEHPVDQQYHKLHCLLQPLDHNSHEYKVIDKYLQSTHASTHNAYTMSLLDVFKVEKEGEKKSFRDDIKNRMLLWHGSRLTNWVGILSRGLCVAPPEAPVTGYMFGKGIYFADMSSKSGNYCFATREKDVGLLLLSEVAIGDCNKLLQADYEADKQLKGKDSNMGMGRVAPDPTNYTELNGVTVPLGPAKETGVVNSNGYTLNYNEYVVYNSNQVRMRYLLKVRFNFAQLW